MFVGLSWLISDDLGLKRRILGVKRTKKRLEDPELIGVEPIDDLDWKAIIESTVRCLGLLNEP